MFRESTSALEFRVTDLALEGLLRMNPVVMRVKVDFRGKGLLTGKAGYVLSLLIGMYVVHVHPEIVGILERLAAFGAGGFRRFRAGTLIVCSTREWYGIYSKLEVSLLLVSRVSLLRSLHFLFITLPFSLMY